MALRGEAGRGPEAAARRPRKEPTGEGRRPFCPEHRAWHRLQLHTEGALGCPAACTRAAWKKSETLPLGPRGHWLEAGTRLPRGTIKGKPQPSDPSPRLPVTAAKPPRPGPPLSRPNPGPSPPRATAERSAGRGRGRERGPAGRGRGRERARAPHSPPPGAAHSRVPAVRPVRVRPPPPPGSLPGASQRVWAPPAVRRCPDLRGPGPRTRPQSRTVWTRRLSRSRRQSEPRRGAGGGTEEALTAAGGRADLCPPEAPLLPRTRGRRLARAERGMSRRRPRALGARGGGSASPHAAGPRGLGHRGRAGRGRGQRQRQRQRRPRSGGRRRG